MQIRSDIEKVAGAAGRVEHPEGRQPVEPGLRAVGVVGAQRRSILETKR